MIDAYPFTPKLHEYCLNSIYQVFKYRTFLVFDIETEIRIKKLSSLIVVSNSN